MTIFVIEDEFHAEWQGQFQSSDAALADLQARASVPWSEAPNRCPCTSWKTCGRDYVVIEFDDRVSPWEEIGRTPVLSVGATGAIWHTKD
jgi:hypothetical protein